VFNAKIHAGEVAVAKADIKKFYPSTNKAIVKSGFKKYFRMADDIAETLTNICVFEGHIPTGSPLSQSLSYFINKPVFDHINTYARARDLVFSLYVDDLTFSGKVIPKYFLDYLKQYMREQRGYLLHKFRRYNSETEKVVTGVVINGDGLTLKRSQRQKIKIMKDAYNSHADSARAEDPKVIRFFQVYMGHLFAAGQISPRYRQMGKQVARARKELGIKGINQHNRFLLKSS
jgi:hypothetical protein